MKLEKALEIAGQVRGGGGLYQLPPNNTVAEVAEALAALGTQYRRLLKVIDTFDKDLKKIAAGTAENGTGSKEE